MSSYNSDGGRIPRFRDVASQSRNVSSSSIRSTSAKPPGPATSPSMRSQIARPINPPTRYSRASSFSEAEENRPIGFQSNPSSLPLAQALHPLLPPRATTHPLPTSSSPLPIPALTSEHHVQQVPYTETSPIIGGAVQHNPVQSRPRNVLRRKAPTIGQHIANNISMEEPVRPERLNVIIPARSQPAAITMAPSQAIKSSTQLNEPNADTDIEPQMAEDKRPEQVLQGPRELASLRTTLNTHNLPPPTPVFHSASSPSTRYSESPGVWSRTSTPTSLSSYSPGIVQPVKSIPRLRQPSPSQSRLPVFSPRVQESPQSQASAAKYNTPDPSKDTGLIQSPGRGQSQEPGTKASVSRLPGAATKDMQPRPAAKSNLPKRANFSTEKESANEKGSYIHSLPAPTRGSTHRRPSYDRALPPLRPSREGTHRLVLEPSPVVHSSLSPGTVTNHKRRGSAGSSSAGDRPNLLSDRSAAASVDSLQSRSPSRAPAYKQGSPGLPRKSPRTLTKEPKIPREPPSPSKSRRFGFFGKKSRSDLNAQSPEETRAVRRGPAAGTGHEGYGRYAQRGRKSSVGSSGSTTRARSTSTTRSVPKSTSSKGSARGRPDADLDDFLLDRLEPVVIHGGGMEGATLMRTQSEQSSGGVSTGSTSNIALYPTTTQSTGYSTESLATNSGAVSESGKNYRPVVKNSPVPPEHSAIVSPPTSRVDQAGSSYPTSQRTLQQQEPNISAKKDQTSAGPRRLNPKQPSQSKSHQKKLSRKGLGLKWPFFQRDPGTEPRQPEPAISAPQLQVTVSPVAIRRQVAHYALVDADSDPLEDIIHHVEESPPTDIEDHISSAVEVPAALKIRKGSDSILLPSPPKLYGEWFGGPSSPKVYFNREHPPATTTQNTTDEGRPTRLASVGRIPRVVSRRERKHIPACQSFSRPFSTSETPSLPAPVKEKDHGFSPTNVADSDQHRRGFDLTQPFGNPMDRTVLDMITGPYAKYEFLTFSPGTDSMPSSSGSENMAAVTAVIPNPDSALNEDEVWGEYDDLIDHVLSRERTRPISPIETAENEKFEMATMASRALQAELNGNGSKQTAPAVPEQPTVALTPASPCSSNGSVHLRRSRIVSALHSSIAPSTQPSYSDIIASYRDSYDGCDTSERAQQRNTAAVASPEPKATFLRSPSLNPSPSVETCRQRNTILFDIAERDREGPTAQTNIRSGSLMTSRWLSFGRVLFSPAHNRVKDGGDRERILVIDEVYALDDGPAPTGPKHPAAWMPPSNHHIIHHASLEAKLPFPRGYFTVTVLRFPAASSEAVQANVISECKRVLRPGGYMEMSVLDLDMVNMGIRTRKAVRQLKERTYLSDANISLKPTTDSVQRLLGRYGFDNLRRCMVRIPVAGMIVRTSASSSSTVSSANQSSTLAATTATPLTNFSVASTASIPAPSKAHEKSSSNDTDLSLGDLLSDPSPSPSNDESIRKIVAKVGRWWYTRCYEIPVLPNGDADLSIWADKKIIRECQQRGTGFRFLIAYAQKPSEKRRTASV
ncbi:hypothetical protein BDV59DRAFT_53389 [Aspergillus ambiguus]|uniref:uncharacterized protein n=1 Tax=Aspergillus ambiguus TaxID=176160 RepID=UPI003CCDE3D9